MRTKKDPGIRQEAFIQAATALFMEKGYEAVSIRDVLDAVGDKTASPSVFYYYFKSKDALYHACVEAVARAYLAEMETGFSTEGKTAGTWMLSLVGAMETYLLNEKNLIATGRSTKNRLFILDMREKVTNRIALLWGKSLAEMFSLPPGEAASLAGFLAGGIGELMFGCLTEGCAGEAEIAALSERIVIYCMNTIGCPETQKQELIEMLKAAHEK